MTVEQKPELNRFVDPSIPLTWGYRWRQLKMTLPIWIFSWLCFLETALLKAWLADKLSPDFALTLLGAFLFLLFFIFGIVEVAIRIQQRSKRVMRIDDKSITVKPARNQFIRWKHISKFRFEPITEAQSLTKLSVFGLALKRISRRARWLIVMDSPTQVRELISYLQMKKAAASAVYEIEILENPSQSEASIPFPYLGMSLYWSGTYLLLHGVPLLFVAFAGGHSDTNTTEEQRNKVGRVIAAYFSNVEQLRHFYVGLGLALTGFGIALLVWGRWLMGRKTPA
jgi:hypothetical protein